MTKAIAAPQFDALRTKLGIIVATESSGSVDDIDTRHDGTSVLDGVEKAIKTPRRATASA
jgi:hypothetical protein